MKMKLEDADTLGEITAQLGMITYLQGLLLYDKEGKSVLTEDLAFVRRDAENYLWDWQCEVVLKLKKLICKEDFITIE